LDIIFNEQDSYLRSEQAVIEGHPLHPGAKLRKGLNANENIKYSSEYNKEINLKCVLIHQSIAKTETLSLTYNDELKSHFPELYQRIENECTGFIKLDD
ncbi:IucA/IucC family protein, partial [Staphylococcus aureus]|nr:IucA/IucC family protein [Staphylococcus aureus]